jgi:hypothetical protein
MTDILGELANSNGLMNLKSATEPDTATLLAAQRRSILRLFEQLRDPQLHLKEGQEDHGQGGPQRYRWAHEIIGALMAHTEGVQRRLLPLLRENAAAGGTLSEDLVRDDDDLLAIRSVWASPAHRGGGLADVADGAHDHADRVPQQNRRAGGLGYELLLVRTGAAAHYTEGALSRA